MAFELRKDEEEDVLSTEVGEFTNGTSKFEEKSYWKSEMSEPLKRITIGQLMKKSASEFADRIAISMYGEEKLTYDQVDKKTDVLAAAFLALGLRKGNHIAIWGFNSVEWYLSFVAAMKAGMVAVNVNPLFQPPELESCLLLSDAEAIILNELADEHVLYDILTKVIPEIDEFNPSEHIQTKKLPLLSTVITTSHQSRKGTYTWSKLFDMADENHQKLLLQIKSEIDIFDICDIQFTSGTTSAPKGVLLTHHNLVNNGYWIGRNLQLNERHHKLCALPPFFHAYGLAVGIIASIWFGATTILPYKKYSPSKLVSCIIEEKCDLIYGTPTMFIDLSSNLHNRAQQDPQIYKKLSCVQRMFTGGATCLPEVIHNLKKHFPWLKVTSGYGMTELSPVTFMSQPNDPSDLAVRTIGRLLEHMEAKVINQNSEAVSLGAPGELCFRGYMVMKGYYKNLEKTREVIDNEGWFHTGDRAVLLKNGYAQIVGRIKDTIIRGGENIEPKEIEEVIMKHTDVIDIQVYGVHDDRLGEVVAASIIKKEKCHLNEEAIRKFCSGKMASYKIPQYIAFCTEYPKTASGKIQKFKLRRALEEKLSLNLESKIK